MPVAVSFTLLGAHRAGDAHGSAQVGDEEKAFDAFDVAVRLADETTVVCGLRTSGYLSRDRVQEVWADGYVPLPTTIDFSAVRHYDFDALLWLGPQDHPCLVWGNAIGMNRRAIAHLLSDRPGSRTTRHGTRRWRLLDGPDGSGLPTPTELGISVAADAVWYPVASRLEAS